MNKLITIITMYLLCLVLCTENINAQETGSKKNGLDVVFVIDSSGSMKSNDKNRVALEMVKVFVDTVHIDNMRIGFVVYNDTIVSSKTPVAVSDTKQREELKQTINSIQYSGNTDIGLGLSYAREITKKESGRNRIMVLISDGETDLGGSTTGRTLKQSELDLKKTVQASRKESVPIFTIAFGKYDGSKKVLNQIADDTNAASYSAEKPEALIEVLYGIFSDNISFQIQEVTNSIYAKGNQEIRYILDEMYLDQMNFILISPQNIGKTEITYGKKKVKTTDFSHYLVGKITKVDSSVNELNVKVSTSENQSLKAYLISYRNLSPILNMDNETGRNDAVSYQVYFKDKKGEPIYDDAFYKKFEWNIAASIAGTEVEILDKEDFEIRDGAIKGSLNFDKSGTYQIKGALSDKLGSYKFNTDIKVSNTPPSGGLPPASYTILTSKKSFDLEEYFKDSNNDNLQFSMESASEAITDITLDKAQLIIKPKKSGTQTLTLFVNDGEDTLAYPYQITVVPLWQRYWWVIAIFATIVGFILFKILYKPKPELVQIVEKKAQFRFHGKLDAYCTAQPENREEIPPLIFPMYKMKVNKISLGDLMKDYPEASEAMGLDRIYLIADEDRHMILYHVSNALIMIGNSIVCRQFQYSISFGNVIYITSQDHEYELEVHYIAMIQ